MPEMKETYIRILDYLAAQLTDDPVYEWILQQTAARGIPQIQITPVQGRFLHLLVQLVGARRILEVGTLAGYSTVWMARALPADGRLITLEANSQHAALAYESFRRAGVDDRVELHVGPALNTLARLSLDAPLDVAFIDADKSNNLRYFQWAVAHTRPGGLVIVDNIFMNGRAIEQAPSTPGSIAAFNQYVFEHYGDSAMAIPFFKQEEDNLDGMVIVRVS